MIHSFAAILNVFHTELYDTYVEAGAGMLFTNLGFIPDPFLLSPNFNLTETGVFCRKLTFAGAGIDFFVMTLHTAAFS